MTAYHDSRFLSIAYVTDDGAVLLDDEMFTAYERGDFPSTSLTLDGFDVEREIWQITGVRGASIKRLCPEERERYRLRIALELERI